MRLTNDPVVLYKLHLSPSFRMMDSTKVSASSATDYPLRSAAAVKQLRCFIPATCLDPCVLFCSDGGDETQIAVCAELAGAKLWQGRSLKHWSLSKLLVLIKAALPSAPKKKKWTTTPAGVQ